MKSVLLKEINYSEKEPSLSIDASLQFKNYNVSLINSVRRIILSDIPNVAFKNVTIRKNTTLAHNEFIKHRINLIPTYIEIRISKLKVFGTMIYKKENIVLKKMLLYQYSK